MTTLRVNFHKSASRSITYHRYPDVKRFDISPEGVLTVKGQTGSLAAYSAGNWTDVYFEDAVGDAEAAKA
ncbi:hypothetical protein [Rhodococcus tibetensis]|uniref:Uncharacterized protein n=1 Tax=Rhodococcus tibetensis TaxID=2965064 RepID=A0ABT1QDU5_9NOCA|nr:hypothetical protein [Rhodococcus sp. FXJ9.536]MCQ4120431.1 hypothetical protein [Rhodococcus sp. FXJ9.536]